MNLTEASLEYQTVLRMPKHNRTDRGTKLIDDS